MSRFFDLVSKPVRDMGGYAPALPAKPSVVEQLRLIGLDSNENPFGPSPRAVEAMLAALTSANSYPEDDCTELRRRLATFHAGGLSRMRFLCGPCGALRLYGRLRSDLTPPGKAGSSLARNDNPLFQMLVLRVCSHIGSTWLEALLRRRVLRPLQGACVMIVFFRV